MLELEVLVGELLAVDALAASTVALGEVTALKHECLDHTVEARALVAVALLASAQGTEVLDGLRYRLHYQPVSQYGYTVLMARQSYTTEETHYN